MAERSPHPAPSWHRELREASPRFLFCKMGMRIPPQDSKLLAWCQPQRWHSIRLSYYCHHQCCYYSVQPQAAHVSTKPPQAHKVITPQLHVKVLDTLTSSPT